MFLKKGPDVSYVIWIDAPERTSAAGDFSAVFAVPSTTLGTHDFSVIVRLDTGIAQATAEFTVLQSLSATPVPTPEAKPTATPRPKTTPTPARGPLPSVVQYAPLLAEAASSYPAGLDFVREGLSPGERMILDVADSRLFSNPNFLASKWGPDNWPSDVKTASVQAIPLLMKEINIREKSNGKHVVTWPVDGLDRILDDLDIYKGMCVPCYGKNDYATVDEVRKNQYPIVNDPQHVHREMLKSFAYLAKADGEGILMRGFMENDADEFEMLYKRDLPVEQMFTDTSFGWKNQSFMSRITLPDGTVESFPTTVYKIIGNAGNAREAVETWLDYLNKNMKHFIGGTEDFANIYRKYSQTPYTPEQGYLILEEQAGSPSSTGLTTSAFRSLGIKAEQFLSPEYGERTGSVELNVEVYYYNGNDFWHPLTKNLLPCGLLRTLKQVEYFEYDTSCDK